MDNTRSDMVTLPNGIQIPRKQFEEETRKKDSRGHIQEQTIGKSQAQIEREQKDKEARQRFEQQSKKFKEETSDKANRRIGAKMFEKSITDSRVRKPETQKAVLTMEERKERSRLIGKQKFKTITQEELERLAELNQRQAIYDEQQEGNNKHNGMGMGR